MVRCGLGYESVANTESHFEFRQMFRYYSENGHIFVGFEVFTAVTMKIAVFWGVAPCRRGRLNRRFGG
jgi:hypothetical protein